MQVSAQGFVNIARRFLLYNALLRDAHLLHLLLFYLLLAQTGPRRAEGNVMRVPEGSP